MVYSLSFMEGSDEIMGTATSKLFTLEARLVPTSPSPRPTIPEPRSSILDPRTRHALSQLNT